MTLNEQDKVRRIGEVLGALACALVVALWTNLFFLPSPKTGPSQHDEGWIASAIALGSYLATFGVLDRAAQFIFGPVSEWRFNWVLIPFVGLFFFLLNMSWYFPGEYVGFTATPALIAISFVAGLPLLAVTFVFWFGGYAYCAVKVSLAKNMP